jgi:hypothetical protein
MGSSAGISGKGSCMTKQNIYWGVLCHECSEPIAFGSPANHQFEFGTSHARPGRISCSNGHTALYYPRDFSFFESSQFIAEAVMQANREAHGERSPMAVVAIDSRRGIRWAPSEESASVPDVRHGMRAVAVNSGSDARRQSEQDSAQRWWAAWAARKVS